MTLTTIETQGIETDINCDNTMAPLYEAIRLRISESFFSRLRIDEVELLHVIFMKLLGEDLPAPDSGEMTELLDREITGTIRDFKRAKKPNQPVIDIDDADPDEDPSYDERENAEEIEFEKAFEKFCLSFPEPKRSIYLRSRTHSRDQLSKISGVPIKRIYKMLREMSCEFEVFLRNFRE